MIYMQNFSEFGHRRVLYSDAYQMEREFYAELVQIKIKAEEYLRRTKQEQ